LHYIQSQKHKTIKSVAPIETLTKKAQEILALAIKDKKERIFFQYAPHTQGLSVEVYSNGFRKKDGVFYNKTIYLDEKNASKELDVLKIKLKNIVQNN
jgi:hypothetical protein